jgi:lysine-specific demethylase PHF8
MEKQMQTPQKYLFPSFEAAHWFAAEGLIQDLQTLNATSFVPAYLIKGLKALVGILKLWLAEKDVRRTLIHN